MTDRVQKGARRLQERVGLNHLRGTTKSWVEMRLESFEDNIETHDGGAREKKSTVRRRPWLRDGFLDDGWTQGQKTARRRKGMLL